MGKVRMNNEPVAEGFVESNSHSHDKLRNKVTGEDQGVLEEDDFQIESQAPGPQRLQIQDQGQGFRWEGFLNRRLLKVLLVENDDSTRHIVHALLQNCGYEVTAVPNGLQAWKTLEDLTNSIDLVLAEVVMPSLSGIGLLTKIMSHKTRKNIPVIMMSSYDSVNIVFKCLSKGAVDFLAKPIRKNELKNLWQNVWRKCHSSSGSGSESGTQTQKSRRSDSIGGSENNSGSNNDDGNESLDINVKDGSDNGSDTQSPWRKRTTNVDSPQIFSHQGQSVDPSDGKRDRVVHSMPEPDGQPDHKERAPINDYILHEGKKTINVVGENDGEESEPTSKHYEEQPAKGLIELNNEAADGELKTNGLRGNSIESTEPQLECFGFDVPKIFSKVSEVTEGVIDNTKETPCLDLSLDGLRSNGDKRTTDLDQKLWRHSGVSAFSRYKTASTANQTPTGIVGSCSPLDNSSDAAKTESVQNLHSSSSDNLPNQGYISSNNNDMGSSTNNFLKKPSVPEENPIPSSTVKCQYPSSAFQPVQNNFVLSVQPLMQGEVDVETAKKFLTQARDMHRQIQVQHHHHYYQHYHQRVFDMPQQPKLTEYDDISSKIIVAPGPACGSSNVKGISTEGNTVNCSLNGSASGSNNGSNGQNGRSSGDTNDRENNLGSGNGVNGYSGAGDRNNYVVFEQRRLAFREAALHRFRQKRKQRCFEKKVRYQSRKILAEQRPRNRGQFVQQMNEKKSKCTDS